MKAPYQRSNWNDSYYKDVVTGFTLLVAELDPQIPLVLVSDGHEPGEPVKRESVENFKDNFGDDHYDFVVGGVKVIVANSNFDYGDVTDVYDLSLEHNNWLALSLRDSEEHDYKHVIVIQHALFGFTRSSTHANNNLTGQETRSAFYLEKLAKGGADFMLTYQGHREKLQVEGHAPGEDNETSSQHLDALMEGQSEGGERSSSSGEGQRGEHKHYVKTHVEEKARAHESHHAHSDHLDKSHSHSHAYYEAPRHEHRAEHTQRKTKFLEMEVLFSTDLDEDQYRMIWVFEENIEEQVFEV